MTGQGKIILVDAKIFFSGFRNRLRLPRNWPLSVYSKTQRSIAKALSGERRKQTLIREYSCFVRGSIITVWLVSNFCCYFIVLKLHTNRTEDQLYSYTFL